MLHHQGIIIYVWFVSGLFPTEGIFLLFDTVGQFMREELVQLRSEFCIFVDFQCGNPSYFNFHNFLK